LKFRALILPNVLRLLVKGLGLDRESPATIPVFVVTGGGYLLARGPLDPNADRLHAFLYWAVTALAIAMVVWGLLYLGAVGINVATAALKYRHRVGFGSPVFLRSDDDVLIAAADSQLDLATTARRDAPAPPPADKSIAVMPSQTPDTTSTNELLAGLHDLSERPSASPEIRVSLRRSTNTVLLVIKNDGPAATFKVEVLKVTSPNFHERAEETAWPWTVGWGQPSVARREHQAIPAAGSAECVLLWFDERGAQSQLASQGGYAFVFPGPALERHRLHGRLGITEMADLVAERLEITVRVTRLGVDPAPFVERRVCVSFMNDPDFCD
jgi:hypothetical protein